MSHSDKNPGVRDKNPDASDKNPDARDENPDASDESVHDPLPNPEPAVPSLAEPDPGVFHHEPATRDSPSPGAPVPAYSTPAPKVDAA